MTSENSASGNAGSKQDESRARSTIEFPYFDLDSALEVAQGVKNVGGTACDLKQLATKLDMAADGGGFRTRLNSAKTFALIDSSRGQIELTELGIRAVDPAFERQAKLDAFLTVPLYKSLFDKLNGQTLPPAAAIERMAEQLGVAPKQKDKARQAFMRSAKTAGLFELSSERMTIPPSIGAGVGGANGSDANRDVQKPNGDGGGGGDQTPPGRLRFEVPIPGKPSAVVLVPDDLDADDWEMLNSMMTTYISRWKKFGK